MPVRDQFPRDYFDTNPMEGESPHGVYKRLQWGREPRESWTMEAPEPLAVLGRLAALHFVGGGKQRFRDGEFFVAVGTRSNHVYFVPMDEGGEPLDFPEDFARECLEVVQVKRTDYYSEKGDELGYYYHDHEKPYPMLCGVDEHFVLLPAKHRGGRSYAVNDEGIIG